jgi:NAD+ kinase
MKVLFFVNNNKDKDYLISKEVVEYLNYKNITVYTNDEELVKCSDCSFASEDSLKNIDFALVLGGDGTVLKFACNYAKYGFPYVGINMGRVGALTILELNDYKSYVDKIVDGDYLVCEQLGLDGKIRFTNNEEVEFTSYNDIVLHRGLSLKLLPISISVNESEKDVFYADGLIISTPVGSSAYNASSGGPLLSYGSKSYVMTPICPQSKSFVPLVVSDDDNVWLSVDDKSNVGNKEVIVSVDGYYKYFISPHDEIMVKKSDSTLKMIQFRKDNSLYTAVYKAVSSIYKKGEK